MAPVPFTDREMQRAWRTNLEASMHVPRSNAHRLLLFYSIECGLKAVLMKRRAINCTNLCDEIGEAQHNINKLLDHLSAGQRLKLPAQLQMDPINVRGNNIERRLDTGKINQVWRYGGYFVQSNPRSSASNTAEDNSIENQLILISKWIDQELKA